MEAAEFVIEWDALYTQYGEINEYGAYGNWRGHVMGALAIEDPLSAATSDYNVGRFTYYAYLRLYGWLAGNPDLYVADKYHLHDGEPPAGTYRLTVSVTPVGAGSVTLDPAPVDGGYAPDTHVTLTALAGQGYSFSGWSGDASGQANPTTIVMDGDKAVTAGFASSGGGPSDILGQMLPLMLVMMIMGAITPMMEEAA